ncbi:MAG: DUF4189 domain-containing protein [Hyphomicrobiaceae bacterium]|nr:DUF4189 domain-containing protein [Hyphomicrobiaceae bacterium]
MSIVDISIVVSTFTKRGLAALLASALLALPAAKATARTPSEVPSQSLHLAVYLLGDAQFIPAFGYGSALDAVAAAQRDCFARSKGEACDLHIVLSLPKRNCAAYAFEDKDRKRWYWEDGKTLDAARSAVNGICSRNNIACAPALSVCADGSHLAAAERSALKLPAALAWPTPRFPDPLAPRSADLNARIYDMARNLTYQRFYDRLHLIAKSWTEPDPKHRARVLAARTASAFAALVNQDLARIERSHTGLYTPDDVFYYLLVDVFRGSLPVHALVKATHGDLPLPLPSIGAFVKTVEGRHYVDSLLEGAAADVAGLRYGDEIVHVDGQPFTPVRVFRDKVGTSVRIGIRRSAGGAVAEKEVAVKGLVPHEAFRDATGKSVRIVERSGRRIGYFRVWSSVGRLAGDAFESALVRLQAEKAEALIIDARGAIGGNLGTVRRYMALLTANDGPARSWARDRIVLLIDHHTRSAGEVFAQMFRNAKLGRIIGTTTAKAVIGSRLYPLPDGSLLYLPIQRIDIAGVVLEGRGVAPDLVVERPLAYAAGADPVLERALALLAVSQPASPPPAAPAAPAPAPK